jgi:hypothetical protein
MDWAGAELFARPSQIIPTQLQKFQTIKCMEFPLLHLLHIKMSQKYFQKLHKSKYSHKDHAG